MTSACCQWLIPASCHKPRRSSFATGAIADCCCIDLSTLHSASLRTQPSCLHICSYDNDPHVPVLQGVDIVPKRHNQGRNDWSAKDKLTYITVLLKHGKDWEKLSAAFPERDPVAVRKFWTNHHRSLRLDQLMEERPELDTSALTTA